MVQGVGGTGDFGSLKNMKEYQVYYPQYQAYLKAHPESTLNFEGWLTMKGKLDYFTQQLDNYVETGNSDKGDGQRFNTINDSKHISSATGAIYQSADEETFYQFDFETGDYRVMTDINEVKAAIGIHSSQDVDMIEFGRWSAVFTDYTFGELDDGQDTTDYQVSSAYGGVVLTDQEFDIHYILDALLMDPSDPQYQIAKGIFDKLCANTEQWLPASDLAILDETAAKYGTNSGEYKAVLKNILLSNLDQANEWVEEHSHVKNTASLSQIGSTEGTNNNGDSSNSTSTPVVPEYSKEDVLQDAGLLTQYSSGEKRKTESTDNSKADRRTELLEQLDNDLNSIISALQGRLGAQCTEEMLSYMNKAKSAVANNEELLKTWSEHHGFMNMHVKTLGEYSIQAVSDAFFKEFDMLCKNGGKTDAEVEADKKAAEEAAAKQKAGYQQLYNMDLNSVAKDLGVDRNKQVVNVSSASDIQAKAEADILEPINAKIRAQMANSGVSSAELDLLIDQATNYALSYCTEWAAADSPSYNYYTINANALVDKYEEAIKAGIKNKGYSF